MLKGGQSVRDQVVRSKIESVTSRSSTAGGSQKDSSSDKSDKSDKSEKSEKSDKKGGGS